MAMIEPERGLIEQAQAGARESLEAIITAIQPRVYNLALRMLGSPAEAEDATQEILIKVITHLSAFRGESAFTTWVHRIAVNHLLTVARSVARRPSFAELGEQLEGSLALSSPDIADEVVDELLVTEVRRSCTLGMLLCLDREQRIVLILGEVFELSSEEGAAILEIAPAAFRKRLSRARAELVAFVGQRCGVVNPAHPCRCHKHIRQSIQMGKLDPEHLQYAPTTDLPSEQQYFLAQQQELDTVCRTAALLRALPQYTPARSFVPIFQAWLANPNSHLLENVRPGAASEQNSLTPPSAMVPRLPSKAQSHALDTCSRQQKGPVQ